MKMYTFYFNNQNVILVVDLKAKKFVIYDSVLRKNNR